MKPPVLHGYFLLQCTAEDKWDVCLWFSRFCGNQLLLIFIWQLALGSLKEVPNDPSGQSQMIHQDNPSGECLWWLSVCIGDTNSPQLVDNLSEVDKDNLCLMRYKVYRNTDSMVKRCQLAVTTLTNRREWDNWMFCVNLMKMEQITELQWQVFMKVLTLKVIRGGKLIKILNNSTHLCYGLVGYRLYCNFNHCLNLVRECISSITLNWCINVNVMHPIESKYILLVIGQSRPP